MRRLIVFTAVVVLLTTFSGAAHAAQLGALLSPGPLSKAHATLEGGLQCGECHEAGRKVTAARCLTCHKPIAQRIARQKGPHRAVTECVSCHSDHAGPNADIRRLDTRAFDHAAQTGYALDGLHARAATNCAACHKQRSFLEARTECASCHADVHRPTLGTDCTRCHSPQVTFKGSRERFDHTTTRFQLTGAHKAVACEKCHKQGAFRDVALRTKEVGACTACHADPHQRRFDATCTSCHTTEKWDTRTVTHARTRFPLVGAHAQAACAKCHQDGDMTRPLRFDRCSACHANVHRDSITEDCGACHTETTFKGAPFDHGVRTSFALEGKHEALRCVQCHTSISPAGVPLAVKNADYRGAPVACVGCHADGDHHKGVFGRACDACHRTSTFDVKAFAHPRAPDFYGGQHRSIGCEQCHVPDPTPQPRRTKMPSMECAACHRDVHLGQVATACERCHDVGAALFAASRFTHDTSRFPLTGKHRTVECGLCHRREARTFPSGTGTAVAFTSIGMQCTSCHRDSHLGQLDLGCESCHQTDSFMLPDFIHKAMDDFFGGFHGKYACKDCHRSETGTFPAGRGTAVRFLVGRTCAACHRGF